MDHYQRLGFATRAYKGGGYGYATLAGCEIHLGLSPSTRSLHRRLPTYSSKTPTSWLVRGPRPAQTSGRLRTPSGDNMRAS